MRPKTAFLADPERRFELLLARDLGMTRAQLRHSMSQPEYVDWLALYSLEAQEREQALTKAKREAQRGW